MSPNTNPNQLNPPMIFGPIAHHLPSLSGLNTSNTRFRNLISGACRESCPATDLPFWVDVRDLALAHVLSVEKAAAGNQRFFVIAGEYENAEIVRYIAEFFPEYRDKLPLGEEALKPGKLGGEKRCWFENGKSLRVLGMEYRGLGECVRDLVGSLKGIPA